MDQAKLQAIIGEFYAKLPANAQAFFGSLAWTETLKGISVMHNLNPMQIEILGTETTLVLLGIIPVEEYEEIIAKELALPKELTEKIVSEISEKILEPLRPTLLITYAQNVEDVNSTGEDEEEDLDPRLSSLPQNVQDAIINSGYQKKLYEIGTKHKLQVSQMAALEEVTVKFISGAISPTKYESDVALATELPATAVKEIAQEVNDTILVSIRENMQEAEKSKTESGADVEAREVPIPPYAPVSPVSTVEKKIELVETKKTKDEDIVPIPPVMAEVNPVVSAEKPALVTPPSFISDKLFAATKTQAVVSDHSLPKVNTAPDATAKPAESAPAISKGFDPYHEAI
jgi:hypothetical protein